MSKATHSDFVDLVRCVLPPPAPRASWAVVVVESFGEAGADIEARIVRVQKDWRLSVFEAGLCQIGHHYPLALEPFEDVDPRAVLQNLRIQWREHRLALCRAITIEQYRRVRFTGDLIVGLAFVAKTPDTGDVTAHWHSASAVKNVLSAARLPARRAQASARALVDLRNKARELVAKFGSKQAYDANDYIRLVSYETLLPQTTLDFLRYDGRQAVPLPDLKEACLDALADMSRDNILNLVVRLGLDISAVSAAYAERNRLTPEDERLLRTLAQ